MQVARDGSQARHRCCGDARRDRRIAASLDDPDVRIALPKLYAAWRIVLARDAVAHVRLAAESYTPGDYGLVGFVVMTSASAREALGHFVRYSGLRTDDPAFVVDDSIVRTEYRHFRSDCAGVRAATESAFIELVQGARLLTQTRLVPGAVRFAHPAASYQRRRARGRTAPSRSPA